MDIGILGAGSLGSALAQRLVAAGHDVLLAFSRSPEKLAETAAAVGARSASVEDCVLQAEVVVLATPWPETLGLLRPIAPFFAGRIVWDATNPLSADMASLLLGTTTSAGEEIARTLPTARVVKAIPPFAERLRGGQALVEGQRPPSVFLCGDDAEARAVIMRLVAEIGADPVEAGPLTLARCTEPLGLLMVQLAFARGLGPGIGCALLRPPGPHDRGG
jgi:predicted dinucleotide-binding enzyme